MVRSVGILLAYLFALVLTGGCGSSGDSNQFVVIGTDQQRNLQISLTPDKGAAAGGTTVSLQVPQGAQVTSISFGGTAVTDFSVAGPGQITLVTPAHQPGLVDVSVVTTLGTAVLEDAFTYLPVPTITSLQPGEVSVDGASGLILSGTGFVPGATTVSIDGQPYTPTEVTSTTLTINAPAHPAGNVEVTVTTPGGTSAPLPGGLTYTQGPIVESLTPSAVPLTGATGVVLEGANFRAGDTRVILDGQTVTPTSVTPTTLIFDAPAHAAGTVQVTVSTSFGTSSPLPGGLTYTAGPTVIALTPSSGPLSGTANVVLTGTGFVPGATTVNLDGQQITPSTVTTTSLTFDAPAHSEGVVAVTVTTPGGTSNPVTGGFVYRAAPTATAISPLYSPLSGLPGVILTGTGFVQGETTVIFDGQELAGVVSNSTTLSFNAPAHSAGVVDVSVRTAGGTSGNVPGGLTYTSAPVATSLLPVAGPLSGSTGVVLSGMNFVPGNTTVTVDGNSIVPTAVTSTSVTFDAPSHAAGNVAVGVTTPGGTASVTGGFTYTEAPTAGALTPASGPISGGSSLTLAGGNFVPGSTTVIFDGATLTPSMVTATSLTFVTPEHLAGNVSVSIATPGGSAAVSGGFTYVPVPTVDTLTPAAGPITGTTGVTLTGTGFVAGTTVNFAGLPPITPTSVSSTSLTFDAPAHDAGTVAVTVTTPGGTSSAVIGGFTYRAAPTATAISPPSGHPSVGTPVTITGMDFSAGETSVTIGGNVVPASLVTVTSATTLQFTTPSHAPGNVEVTVTTPFGTSAALPGGYTYELPGFRGILASLAVAPPAGTTSLTLTTTSAAQPGDLVFVTTAATTELPSGGVSVTDSKDNTYKGTQSGSNGSPPYILYSQSAARLDAFLPAGSEITVTFPETSADDVVAIRVAALRGTTEPSNYGTVVGSNVMELVLDRDPVPEVPQVFFVNYLVYEGSSTLPSVTLGSGHTDLPPLTVSSATRSVGIFSQYKEFNGGTYLSTASFTPNAGVAAGLLEGEK